MQFIATSMLHYQNHPQKRPRVCGAGGECCAMKQKRRGDRGYPNHTAPSLHPAATPRSEEHTSELQSLMRISYAVFCLKKKNTTTRSNYTTQQRSSKKNITIINIMTIIAKTRS